MVGLTADDESNVAGLFGDLTLRVLPQSHATRPILHSITVSF